MKKFLICILTLLIIACVGASLFYAYNLKNKNRAKEEVTTKDTLPKEDEPYEKEETVTSETVGEEGKDVELKYDQYITASGYAGAADNVYYTRNRVLYHFVISTEQTTRLAEGVDKIEEDLDSIRAIKGKDFKLIYEDDYVVYVD